MTDDQIEKLIWKEIKRREITYYDMTSLANHGVDPTPEVGYEGNMQRIRSNIFKENFGSERMKELLCVGEYNRWDDYPPLKVSFQDLFRFWWNRCVEREDVVDDVLEDIFAYFTELMQPPQEEEPMMALSLDFEELPIFAPQEELTRQMVIGENPPKSI